VVCLCVLTFAGGFAFSQDYPPAQGPPQPDEPFLTVSTSLLINMLNTTIQTTLDTINAQIARDADETDVEAHLSFTSTTYKPAMSTTRYPDRPNENVVRIAFIVSYDVTGIRWHGLPYFSRQMGQSIEMSVSCDGWHTNQGHIKITTRADRPYLDDNSFGEEALNFFIAHTLTNMVDGKLRARLSDPSTQSTVLSLTDCNRLGVTSGTAPLYNDGSIDFKKTFIRPIVVPTALDASVAFQSIKRLPARTLQGGVLYDEAEDIQLLLYANQTLRTEQLAGMTEGEERTLSMQPVSLGRLGINSSVVLICNVEQLRTFQKDTRFRVYTRSNGWGHGTQKIMVQKVYWEPPRRLPTGQMTKPIERRVDAYEITALVNSSQLAVDPGVDLTPSDPRAGTRPGAVIRNP
jgi:hypothetical protein